MELTIKTLAAQIRTFSEYLQRVGSELFIEAYRTHGVKSLSIQQLRYLEVIEAKPGISPGELSKAFGVRKPTVSNIILQLEGSGLITKEKSGPDRRVFRLQPTDVTRRIFSKRRSMYAKLARHVMGKLNKPELESLMTLFDTITS
jgi:DNA-binding MarR family transcriptional regulator